MGEQIIVHSPAHFYEKAKMRLEKKDLLGFVSNISKAELLANNEKELLPEITYLQVEGYYKFKEFKNTLEVIPEALKNNTDKEKQLRIKNYQGVVLGYLGELDKSKNIFLDLLNILKTLNNTEFLVEVNLNMVWILWTMFKINNSKNSLDEAMSYLESAKSFFENVTNKTKGKILKSYSGIYFNLGDYENALNFGERALQYFEEKDLPKIYNDLAAMYIELDIKDDGKSTNARDYISKAETIGERFNNPLEVGKSMYNRAMYEVKEDQIFRAFDSLYLAFEFFKEASALTLAFDCLVKINELANEYNMERLLSLKDTLKEDFKGTALYQKLYSKEETKCGE